MSDLADLRRALSAHRPHLISAAEKTAAAVALVARQGKAGAEFLYIERARAAGDPWSGHLAFPGGRLEPGDAGPRQAAERETGEEVGLDLAAAENLGRLDDVTASSLTVLVSGFAYGLEGPAPDLALSAEVADAFWVPVDRLVDPARQRLETFPLYSGRQRRLPAVDLLGPGRPLLWGVTYRFTAGVLQALGLPLPSEAAL